MNDKGFICGYCGRFFERMKALAIHACHEMEKDRTNPGGRQIAR